jgi:hypothetical protein
VKIKRAIRMVVVEFPSEITLGSAVEEEEAEALLLAESIARGATLLASESRTKMRKVSERITQKGQENERKFCTNLR